MKRHEAILVRFYNAVSGQDAEKLEDLPGEALRALSYINPNEMAAPFIIKELEQGKSPKQVGITFQIPRGTVRGIGRKYGILPKKTRPK